MCFVTLNSKNITSNFKADYPTSLGAQYVWQEKSKYRRSVTIHTKEEQSQYGNENIEVDVGVACQAADQFGAKYPLPSKENQL